MINIDVSGIIQINVDTNIDLDVSGRITYYIDRPED